MILFPHAKINLGLDILRRRPDGYHDIATLMIPTRWEEVLELTPKSGGHTELTLSGRHVDCPPEKNLVIKAFRLMETATGGLPPTDIRLHKILPDGAGLGGGSADAAFTLRGLNELYHIGLPADELAHMAAQLGADCPFFIYDKPMLCTGIGTDMTPVTLPDLSAYTLAIVKPAVSVNTAAAYSRVTPHIPSRPLQQRLTAPIDLWQQLLVNDFEHSVFPQFPEIAKLKATLIEMGATYASMSGSGSALFALFAEPADKMSAFLQTQFPHCVTHCERFPAN